MDELLEILEDIRPDVDFEECDDLIDGSVLSSFDILSIISEISDVYDITLTPAEIVPENFNSMTALWNMIKRLQHE